MDIESLLEKCFTPGGIDEMKLKSTLVGILSENKTSLEKFMLALESCLTSTNVDRRLNGLKILSKFIQLQTSSTVNESELSYLIEFLLNRLKDHHSFIPIVTETLLFLVRAFRVNDEQALAIFHALSKEIFSQQLGVEERFQVYQLVGLLFSTHREAYRSAKNEFLYSFMQIIEGERDPRCLMISLGLFAEVASTFSLGLLDEEFFDLVGCYFPIVYNPTKDKEIKITQDDLRGVLKRCFAANQAFGSYAMTLLMEKLESEIENVKLDCYDMIITCAPVYGAECLKSFLPLLWTSVRIDLLKMNPGKLSERAIKALTSVLSTIEPHPEMVESLTIEIFNDLEPALTKISLTLTKPASNCLAAMSTLSSKYRTLVTEHIFPLIMKHWVFNPEKNRRDFIEEFSTFFQNWHVTSQDLTGERFPCQDSIILHLLSSLDSTEESLKISSLECLSHLVQCSIKWENQELESITKAVLTLLLDFDLDDRIRTKVRNVLKFLAIHHPEVTNCDIVQKMLDSISNPQELTKEQSKRVKAILSSLRGCNIGKESLHKLLDLLVFLLRQDTQRERIESIFHHLINLLEDSINPQTHRVFDEKLSPFLPEMLVKTDNLNSSEERVLAILSKLVPFLPKNRKTWIANEISSGLSSMCNSEISSVQKTKNIKILCDFFCRMPLDFAYDWCQVQCLLLELLKSLKPPESDQLLTMVEILLNRLPEEDSMRFAKVLKEYLTQVQDRKSAVKILVHANRAIVIRGVAFSSFFTEDLIWTLTSDPNEKTVEYVAKYLVPSAHEEEYFKREYGGQVFPFYAQKYFSDTFPVLLRSYNGSNDWRKGYFALCLLNHLKNLPRAAMKDEITKFQSLIILNLEGNDTSDNPSTALDCLMILIEMNSSLLQRNVTSIINRLLGLSKNNLHLEIRRKALECLEMMTVYMDERHLLPQRPTVCRKLKVVLDDKKRIVRCSCGSALHKWILLGQPV